LYRNPSGGRWHTIFLIAGGCQLLSGQPWPQVNLNNTVSLKEMSKDRIRWARPDLRDLDCVASPVLISKIDATTMGDQFEILNRKLTLDDPDIWVIGRED